MPKKQQDLNLHSGFVTEVIKQQIGQLVEASDVDCQAFRYDKPLDYVIGYADKFTRKNAYEAFGAHQFDSVIRVGRWLLLRVLKRPCRLPAACWIAL